MADRALTNILGLDQGGDPYPLEAYDIGCDEGSWNSFVRKLWCGAQAMPFALGKWVIGIGIDMVGWALEFRVANALAPVAGLLSRVYDTSLIGPLGVRQVAWTFALFVGGWHMLRSRFSRGASEIASTFLISAIAVLVLANPEGYLRGSIELAHNSSGAVLEAVDGTLNQGGAGQGPEAIQERLGGVLRRSFVAEPYDLINWGEPLTGACADARDEILAGGPWGDDDEPRDIMRAHGCDEQADYNHDPTDSRAAASLVVALTAVAATVLLVLVALGVFIAQITLVLLFGSASLAWVLAMFPGARGVLWWWLGKLVSAIGAAVGATFLLSWLALSIAAVLDATADVSIVQRCLIALLVVGVGFKVRTQISRALEGIGRRVGDHAARATGQHNQWPSLLAAGATGAGLSSIARTWARDIPGGQYAMNRAYMRALGRGHRRGGRSRGGYAGGHGGGRGAARALTPERVGATVRGAARGAGRTARAVAMAPVTGPEAYATVRRRVTNASRQARERLDRARATREQWRFNVRHPAVAMGAAHGQAVAAEQRRQSGEQRRAARPTRPDQPAPRGRPAGRPAAASARPAPKVFTFTTPDGQTITHGAAVSNGSSSPSSGPDTPPKTTGPRRSRGPRKPPAK